MVKFVSPGEFNEAVQNSSGLFVLAINHGSTEQVPATTTPVVSDRPSDNPGLNSPSQRESKAAEAAWLQQHKPTSFSRQRHTPQAKAGLTKREKAVIKTAAVTAGVLAVFALGNAIFGSSNGKVPAATAQAEAAPQDTTRTAKTCTDGNRATQEDIINRRTQLVNGVDTIYLVCKTVKNVEILIGRCVFSDASWPGDMSKPRNVDEAIQKIQLLDQELQAKYCVEAAKNVTNWANNYDFRRDDIVVPRAVYFEPVNPENS